MQRAAHNAGDAGADHGGDHVNRPAGRRAGRWRSRETAEPAVEEGAVGEGYWMTGTVLGRSVTLRLRQAQADSCTVTAGAWLLSNLAVGWSRRGKEHRCAAILRA